MQRGLALDEHEQTLLVGDRIVANALGNYVHFAFIKFNRSFIQLDTKMAFEEEEEFVFVLVAMPVLIFASD